MNPAADPLSQEPPLQRERVRTIFEHGAPGRRAWVCPGSEVPEVDAQELLPQRFRRQRPARLPEVSEPEIVRHYVGLSKRNYDLDSGFYPLGSCTMKHNPRLHERVAALDGHARLHPAQDTARAQGALELMWRLQRALAEIAGLPYVSLQPSAGSHGELAGVLVTRAYHEDRGETRLKVLTPDTAHGTNPATVTMAGMEVVKLATDPATGGIDLDDLRAHADTGVACLMLTNPNTLGVFDPNIEDIARIVHDVGATLYYDGANLNAIMGLSRPGDMGFDIVHFNLHKSFTQPHGGGGPGSGPIAVSERVAPYLPVPIVVRREGAASDAPSARGHDVGPQVDGLGPDQTGAAARTNGGPDQTSGSVEPVFDLAYGTGDGPGSRTIGRMRGWHGNYGCCVRAYAYICSLGADGLRDASETAVLNANYLLARLRAEEVADGRSVLDYLPLAYPQLPAPTDAATGEGRDAATGAERDAASGEGSSGENVPPLCMHEFVLSGGPMRRELQIKTLDLAKRLLDHGYHPPTVYFPLLVDEALMVEPTETETRETLDAFAQAIAEILREAVAQGPEIARNAPYTTPVRRLDEVAAARHPVIRQVAPEPEEP